MSIIAINKNNLQIIYIQDRYLFLVWLLQILIICKCKYRIRANLYNLHSLLSFPIRRVLVISMVKIAKLTQWDHHIWMWTQLHIIMINNHYKDDILLIITLIITVVNALMNKYIKNSLKYLEARFIIMFSSVCWYKIVIKIIKIKIRKKMYKCYLKNNNS